MTDREMLGYALLALIGIGLASLVFWLRYSSFERSNRRRVDREDAAYERARRDE